MRSSWSIRSNSSANSPQNSGVTPSAVHFNPHRACAAPTGLTVMSTNNAVTFNWNAVPGANFYTVYRGTVVNKLGYVPSFHHLERYDNESNLH